MSNFDINLVIILLIGVANAFTAYMSWQTHRNIAILEKNTNSIKDALVASTAKASLAEGTAEGLERGRNEKR